MVESSCLLKSSCRSALRLCQHSVAAILRVDYPFFETQQRKSHVSGLFCGRQCSPWHLWGCFYDSSSCNTDAFVVGSPFLAGHPSCAFQCCPIRIHPLTWWIYLSFSLKCFGDFRGFKHQNILQVCHVLPTSTMHGDPKCCRAKFSALISEQHRVSFGERCNNTCRRAACCSHFDSVEPLLQSNTEAFAALRKRVGPSWTLHINSANKSGPTYSMMSASSLGAMQFLNGHIFFRTSVWILMTNNAAKVSEVKRHI